MGYLGSWKIDDLLTFVCNTHTPATGAATDADSVPAYRVYEDETGTAILTGSMAKLDDTNTTGFYSEQITLSAANGFEKGKCYSVYISAVVGGVTGTMHHSLQVEAEVDANTVSGTVTPAAGSITASVIATDAIDADAIADNAINAGAIATGAITAAKFAAGAIDAAAIAANAIDDDALAADVVTAIQSGLATAAALQTVDDLVDDLESRLTAGRATNLDNLDATVSSRATPAQVNTEADTALADVGLTTTITGRIDAAVSTRATPAQVNTEADTALADVGLTTTITGRIDATVSSRASQTSVDTIDDLLDTEIAAIRTDTAAILDDTGTSGVVVAAASKTGYALSAAGIQAIWDALTSALTTVGSIGKYIVDNIGGGGGGGATAAEVWAYLTASATTVGSMGKLIVDKLGLITVPVNITVSSPLVGSRLTVTKGVTLETGAISCTVPATWTKAYFTLKHKGSVEDTAALIQVMVSNPASALNDGLQYIAGTAATKNQGSIVVDQPGGTVTVIVEDNATSLLTAAGGDLTWDVKFIKSDGRSTRPVAGRAVIEQPSTLAIT